MDSNNRGKRKENENPKCDICGKFRKDCQRCVKIDEFFNRNDISDDDFVENPSWHLKCPHSALKKVNNIRTSKYENLAQFKFKSKNNHIPLGMPCRLGAPCDSSITKD